MKKNPQGSNLSRVKRRIGTIERLNGMLSKISLNLRDRFLLNIPKKEKGSNEPLYQSINEKRRKFFEFWHGFLKTAKAFSLIELMISLIVVSCVTAAFAPVVTKKLQASGVTAGSLGDSLRNLKSAGECQQKGIGVVNGVGYCKLCYINAANSSKSKCMVCSNKCNDNEYHNTDNCKCVNCKTAYGNQCYSCNSTSCTVCIAGWYLDGGTHSCRPAYESPYNQRYFTDPDSGITQPRYCTEGYICNNGLRTRCNNSSSSANNYTHAWCHDGIRNNCTDGYICNNGTRVQCTGGNSNMWCHNGIAETCPEGYTCSLGIRTQCTGGNSTKWCKNGVANTCTDGYICSNGLRSQCNGTNSTKWCHNGTAETCTEGYTCSLGIRTQCTTANGNSTKWCKDGVANTCTEGYTCSLGKRTQCTGSNSTKWCHDGGAYTCTEGYTCYNGKRTQCTTANGNSSKWCHDGKAEACPNGYYCVDGKKSGSTCQNNCKTCASATKCAECNEKYYWVNSNGVCEYCNEGYYCDGKKRLACSTNTWTEAGSTSASSCTSAKCGSGFYCSNGVRTGCQNNCKTCANSTQCSKCQEGYYLASDKTCAVCPDGYWCDGTSSKNVCPSGTWCEGSSCTSSSKCTAANCGVGYVCKDGKRSDGGNDFGNNAYQVGNLYVMKYNLGDGAGYKWSTKPSSVKECTVGSSCSFSGGACWHGGNTAASGCGTSGYNACTRTVCNQQGAKEWCESLGWRLPTKTELETITKAEYNSALNFCSSHSSDGVSVCGSNGQCKGADSDNCFPFWVWHGTTEGVGSSYGRGLFGGWGYGHNSLVNAFSTRCVKGNDELVAKVGDLYVMKHNLGDAPTYDWNTKPSSVKECIAGSSCSFSGGACWHGGNTAASGCGTSGYNACTRTVCNQQGAKEWCESLGWRLPTKTELETITKAEYNSALNFCSSHSSDGVSVCGSNGQCKGADSDNCFPFWVWHGTTEGVGSSYGRGLFGGWGYGHNSLVNAFSTRCVK